MKKQLFQYAIIFHKKNEGKTIQIESEIIAQPTWILAKDEREVADRLKTPLNFFNNDRRMRSKSLGGFNTGGVVQDSLTSDNTDWLNDSFTFKCMTNEDRPQAQSYSLSTALKCKE